MQTYIDAETNDAALYRALSKVTPNEEDRRLLNEFAQDEQTHADQFQMLYRDMTGKSYEPIIKPVDVSRDYRGILRERVLDESGDFRKYGMEYLQTNNNKVLKNDYYRARTDENVHALRLLQMLSK